MSIYYYVAYNMASLVIWISITMMWGFLKAWNKKVAYAVMFAALAFIIMLCCMTIVYMDSSDTSNYDLLKYIGGFIGGLTTGVWVGVGEKIYKGNWGKHS